MPIRLVMGAVLAAVFACCAPAEGQAAPAPLRPREGGKRVLRVLLAGKTTMRDAQFLRSLLTRETYYSGKADLALFFQPTRGQSGRRGVPSDIPPEKILKRFPSQFGKSRGGEEEANGDDLSSYDVVVVYDLDWGGLDKPRLLALQNWVEAGGGLFVVAGPSHTPQLAGTGGGDECRIARGLLPVVVGEPKGGQEQREAEPRRLDFEVKKGDRFLRLDNTGDWPLAGWQEFFFPGDDEGKAASPVRGFHGCQAVKSVRKTATVLARLAPVHPAPGEGEPFLVVMPLGKGRVVFLGSAELWRVREYDEEAYDRLWLQLLWYAVRVEKLAH